MSFADNSDYTPLSSSNRDVVLSIDNIHRRVCFDMVITDDKKIEQSETFTVEMVMVQQPSLEVTMFPRTITFTIQDNDGKECNNKLWMNIGTAFVWGDI